MTDRLTDEELAEFCALVDAARADGDPDSESGMELDDFLDNHVKQIADELKSLRTRPAEPQGLTEEERVDLNWLSGFLGALLEREVVSGSQMERAVRVVRKVVASHLLAAEVRR